MATLIILRGNSGSGKSTVAKALQKRIGSNTLLISQDVVRREMLWVRDGENTAALPLLISLLDYGKSHCAYVILEGILYADWYKPLFEAAKKAFGDGIFAYYYDIPFEETLKRHQNRDLRFEFGENEMRRWWREKDFIRLIPERLLHKDISLEDTVETILGEAWHQE